MKRSWIALSFAVVLSSVLDAPLRAAPPVAEPSALSTVLSNTTVTLPWTELRSLLERDRKPVAPRPPVEFLFGPLRYEAKVQGRTAAVTGSGEVTLLADGWVLVPLAPANGALLTTSVDGQPSPLTVREGQLFLLLEGPGKHRLEVTLEVPVTVEDGTRRFSLPLAPGPLVAVAAVLPEARLEADLPGATAVRTQGDETTTTVSGTYCGGGSAVVAWRSRPPQAVGDRPRLDAETATLATVCDGRLRVRAAVEAQIAGAPLAEVRFTLASSANLLGVGGPQVVRWDEALQAGRKVVTVGFDPPAARTQTVELTYDTDLPEEGGEVLVPLVTVEGARRDSGCVGIESATRLEVRPAVAPGAERIGVSELPAATRGAAAGELQLAYRYPKALEGVKLTLARPTEAAARVYAYTATRVAVEGGALRCQADVAYTLLQAGLTTLRLGLPEDVTVLQVVGDGVREHSIVREGERRLLVVDLKDVARQRYRLGVTYERRIERLSEPVEVPLLSQPDAVQERGSVGIEVRGGLEVTPTVTGAERVDVSELPGKLWGEAEAPLLFGYVYTTPGAQLALTLTRHADLSVLTAMCDTCEAATTVAPDGKTITKLMYVVRNNLKPFMALRLPEGAQVWSVFVDDRPVTPVRNAQGQMLVPLRMSREIGPDDEDADESYAARRDRRRRAGVAGEHLQRAQRAVEVAESSDDEPPGDLKPYDVEVVYVGPAVTLGDKGVLDLALPASDVPVGLAAWAVLLPERLELRASAGNCQSVSAFDLPFQHFAEAQMQRAVALAEAMEKELAMMDQLQQAQQQLAELAEAAKAQGVLPVRVEPPLAGRMVRFQKLLAVDEAPAMKLTYRQAHSGWW